MGKFSSPKPPAPVNVNTSAKQQVKYNTDNAYQQAAFNRPNFLGADGQTQTTTQTGKDAQGNPIFSVNQSLGATGQQFAGGLAALGQAGLDKAQGFLNNPADYTNAATEGRINELGSRRLDPRFRDQEAALRTRLKNEGHDPTGEAYRAEMGQFNEGRNDAYNQLALNARGQAFGEAMQGRQAQVDEAQRLTNPGLQYGAGTTTPSFNSNTAGVNVQNADISGLQQMNADQQWKAFEAKQAQQQAMMGGIAQLGGLGLTLATGGMAAPLMGGLGGLGAMGGGAALSSLGGGAGAGLPWRARSASNGMLGGV